MGTTNSTYVGIYLKVPSKKKPVKQSVYINKEGKTVNTPFDATTGEANLLIEREFDEQVFPWINFEDYDTITEEEKQKLNGHDFSVPAYHSYDEGTIFIINNHKSKYFITNEDYLIDVDLSTINFKGLIDEFKIDYKRYLDLLEKEFGEVNIHFGVVSHAG